MATQTFEEKQKTGLIKKFHTMLGKSGVGSEGKEAILSGYRVESSRDLSVIQLIEICNELDLQMNPGAAELDKARKRLMAAIGGWLQAMGLEQNANKIKAIACRAARKESFNQIASEQLRSLYSAFNKKKKDLNTVEEFTADMIDYLANYN